MRPGACAPGFVGKSTEVPPGDPARIASVRLESSLGCRKGQSDQAAVGDDLEDLGVGDDPQALAVVADRDRRGVANGDRDSPPFDVDRCLHLAFGRDQLQPVLLAGPPFHVDGSAGADVAGRVRGEARRCDRRVRLQTDVVAVCRDDVRQAQGTGPPAGVGDASYPEDQAGPSLGVGERRGGEVASAG